MTNEEIMDAADRVSAVLDRMTFEEAVVTLVGLTWGYYMAAPHDEREVIGATLDHGWKAGRRQAMLEVARFGRESSFYNKLRARVIAKGRALTNRELIELLRECKRDCSRQ